MPEPVLSIITINRNNAAGLKLTLASIFAQSFRNFESIIIDGASTDNSMKVVNSFGKKVRYKISERDNGIYDAMNKGIAKARGKYCLFLNSGDFLFSKDTLKNTFSRDLHAEIIYFDVLIDSGESKVLGKMPVVLYDSLFVEHEIWHQALIQRDLFERFGAYNTSYRLLGDYEFYLRTIVKHRVSTQYMELTFAVFNTFGIGSRPESRALAQQERKRAQWQLLTVWQYFWEFRIKYFMVQKVLKPVVKKFLGDRGWVLLRSFFRS